MLCPRCRSLIVLLLVGCGLSVPVSAQESRRWFDFYGRTDFSFYPPHNEMDLNIRGVVSEEGVDWMGDYYLRYSLEAEVFAEPCAFNRIFFFAKPFLAMGSNHPQQEYTASAEVRALRLQWGAGVHLTHYLDLILQTHKWYIFGEGKDAWTAEGPGGQWSAITLRCRFDTRKR
ncbi:MAG TPA: hypothetical protein PKN61_13020 [Acidobacteriota bacterium]|jgi:hypothetical protein|nr:hypothetical protein [Acidobacteriota bacterium]HNU02191.1 hypothetical protein [Acidobacteriota bacterium]HQO26253.1 hypothetical protein [Acidobacteriota bacterium]HQP74297.1 hypothetical protein [Acidobacteriota bacterium]